MFFYFGRIRIIFLIIYCNCISGISQAGYQAPANGLDSVLLLVHSIDLFQQDYISLSHSQPENKNLDKEKSLFERLWEIVHKACSYHSLLPVWEEEQDDDENLILEPDNHQPLSERILAILSDNQGGAGVDQELAETKFDSGCPDSRHGDVIHLPAPVILCPDTSKEPETNTEEKKEEAPKEAVEATITITTQQIDTNVDSACFQQFVADEIRPRLKDKNYPAGAVGGGNFGCVEVIPRQTKLGYVVIKSVGVDKGFPKSAMTCMLREISAYEEFARRECRGHKGLNNVASLIGWLIECESQTDKAQRIVLVMPNYGLALNLYIQKESFISINTIHWILQEIAQGLNFLHSRQLIHCDLKDANCVINTAEKRGVIIDFGFALSAQRVADGVVRRLGTWCYMAPEVVMLKNNSIKQDVWSYGIIAMKLATLCPAIQIKHEYRVYKKTIDEMAESRSEHLLNYEKNKASEELIKEQLVYTRIIMLKSGLPKKIGTKIAGLESGSAEQIIGKLIILCLEPDPKKRSDTAQIIEILGGLVFEPESEPEPETTTCSTCVLL